MKIGIVGASAAGLFAAISIKKNHPDFLVTIFDKNNKIGRKILATGNGHCNVLNKDISAENYCKSPLFSKFKEPFSYDFLADYLKDLGIQLIDEDGLIYPASYSAESFVLLLGKICQKLNIEIVLETKVLDYKDTSLFTDKGNFNFDRLIFAPGGKSKANLGSDGSLIPVFKKHGYTFNDLEPGLCPIEVKESTNRIKGLRHHALVQVIENKVVIFKEEGEVLFKENGLSGIVIFNASRFMKNNGKYSVVLDLFPNQTKEELLGEFNEAKKVLDKDYLKAFFSKELADYFYRDSAEKSMQIAKELTFSFSKKYPFEDSQISIGGLPLDSLSDTLESLLEKGVYFAGEIIDVDGPCGGFNLGWALYSGIVIGKHLS